MIAANELRIGNWFLDTDGDYQQVEELPAKLNAFGNRWEWIKHLQPIQLTPEILEKCGFTIHEGRKSYPFYRYKHLSLMGRSNGFCINVNHIYVYIQSVHQLQNLYFCLTGQELEIKL